MSICDEPPGPASNWLVYKPTAPGEIPGFQGLNGGRRSVIGHGIRRWVFRDREDYYAISYYARRTNGTGASIELTSTACLADVKISTFIDADTATAQLQYRGTSIQLTAAGRLWILPPSVNSK